MTALSVLYQVAGILGGCITIAGVILLVLRGRGQAAIAAEWKELAMVKAAKIGDLEKRVSQLEAELQAVRHENDEYRQLNLKYQSESVELRGTIAELTAELRHHRQVIA